MSNIQHSSAGNEHYTPPEVVEAARKLMRTIDLDPFSCAEANKIVQAKTFYSEGGFEKEYHGTVFDNPPGGKLDPKTFQPIAAGPGLSSAAVAWWHLLDEYDAGRATEALFVVFSLNMLQCAQQYDYRAPYSFPFVVPSKRLRFWNARTPIGKGSPSQPNMLVYLPPKGDITRYETRKTEFMYHFKQFGEVRL